MLEPKLIERIRTIFLYRRPHVSLARSTALLGWTPGEMAEAIRTGEIEITKTSAGKRVDREELRAKALEVWPLDAIEEALGPDADRALPASLRLTDLRVRIPRYHVDMLEHLARRDQTSVSNILTRELEAVASAYAEELSSLVGLESSLGWLSGEKVQVRHP